MSLGSAGLKLKLWVFSLGLSRWGQTSFGCGCSRNSTYKLRNENSSNAKASTIINIMLRSTTKLALNTVYIYIYKKLGWDLDSLQFRDAGGMIRFRAEGLRA